MVVDSECTDFAGLMGDAVVMHEKRRTHARTMIAIRPMLLLDEVAVWLCVWLKSLDCRSVVSRSMLVNCCVSLLTLGHV